MSFLTEQEKDIAKRNYSTLEKLRTDSLEWWESIGDLEQAAHALHCKSESDQILEAFVKYNLETLDDCGIDYQDAIFLWEKSSSMVDKVYTSPMEYLVDVSFDYADYARKHGATNAVINMREGIALPETSIKSKRKASPKKSVKTPAKKKSKSDILLEAMEEVEAESKRPEPLASK